MTATNNDNFRIYLKLHVQKGSYYAAIRLVNRHDKRTIDLAVYLPNGQRLKLEKGSIKDNQISKGFNTSTKNDLNAYLDELKSRVNQYTFNRKEVTKMEVEQYLYGSDFLESNQRKRSISLALPVMKNVPTERAIQLRNKYPKRRETIEILGVDEEGFRTVEKKQIIIDPLSPDLEDFPRNLTPSLYHTFKNEAFEGLPLELQLMYEEPEHKQLLDRLVYHYIISKNILHRPEIDHVLTIDKPTIKAVEKETGLKINHESQLPDKIKQRLIERQKVRDLNLTPTEEIYQKGLFDRDNIFEMFGTIYYDKNCPETYHKILLRLLEYREYKNPKEHIKHLNASWFIDFFLFLKEKGWYHINTSTLDPLKYDKDIFFQDKPRKPYKPKSLNKMIGIVKTLVNGKANFTFSKKGYLPKIDLDELVLSAITTEKDEDGTRIEHNLNKDELDSIFWLQFDKKKLNSYQELFNTVNKSKTVKISIDDLQIGRDLFILQVMLGGLRGFPELSSAKVLKHKAGIYKVSFFQDKVDNTVTNPLNDYTDKVLKRYDYQMPKLIRYNAQKKGAKVTNEDLLEGHYRSLLKVIGQIVNLDRDIITDRLKYISEPIKNVFNPYFSRKTFGTILSNELNLSDADIELFTGHKGEKTELRSSYIQKDTIENKTKLLLKLKVGKNPYK